MTSHQQSSGSTHHRASWVEPGVIAVLYRSDEFDKESLTVVRVTKVLKRDIVLDNGSRVRKDTLEGHNTGTWSRSTSRLMQRTDPALGPIRDRISKKQRQRRAERAYTEWATGRGSAHAVAEAFQGVAADEQEVQS